MKIRISNGRVIDPANDVDQVVDLYIADGKIIAVGEAPAGFAAEMTIAADRQIVCPGLVDLRAHTREPGQEHKGTIASETRAAVAGGITTLCCPPNTDPVVDSPAVANLIRQRAQTAGFADVLPLGAMTKGLAGEQLSEMGLLRQAGCAGVSNGPQPLANPLILRRAMEYAATYDLTVFVQPDDYWLSNHGCAHEGKVATRLGLAGIPEAAETVAVAGTLALIEQIGVRTHFSLLSSVRAAQMIARAQHDGLPVTADVSAHHLHLTETDVLDFDSACHVRPPLRTTRDRDGLRHWLSKGVIAAVCSDHQPHEHEAKAAPFASSASGISAVETLLPLCLKLVDEGVLNINQMIARLTSLPAQILGIAKGQLGVGSAADVCVFDPQQYWTPTVGNLWSNGHNTPFLDWEMKGRVHYTLRNGIPVHQPGDER